MGTSVFDPWDRRYLADVLRRSTLAAPREEPSRVGPTVRRAQTLAGALAPWLEEEDDGARVTMGPITPVKDRMSALEVANADPWQRGSLLRQAEERGDTAFRGEFLARREAEIPEERRRALGAIGKTGAIAATLPITGGASLLGRVGAGAAALAIPNIIGRIGEGRPAAEIAREAMADAELGGAGSLLVSALLPSVARATGDFARQVRPSQTTSGRALVGPRIGATSPSRLVPPSEPRRLFNPEGRMAIISPSAREVGRLQGTLFHDAEGTRPFAHFTRDSEDELLAALRQEGFRLETRPDIEALSGAARKQYDKLYDKLSRLEDRRANFGEGWTSRSEAARQKVLSEMETLVRGGPATGPAGTVGDTLTRRGANAAVQALVSKHEPSFSKLFVTETNQGDILVHDIEVPKGQRGQGIGSTFMRELTELADQQGKRVILTPEAEPGKKGALERFYQRFGFGKNAGRNRDFTTRETRIRPPRRGGAAGDTVLVRGAQALGGAVAREYVPSSVGRLLTPAEQETRQIANAMKAGDAQAIQAAAREMAGRVPDDAVLVPLPDHTGATTANRALAEAIAEARGVRVADVLGRRGPVESSTLRRRAGRPGLTADEHAASLMLRDAIPPGARLVLIDNVETTGATANAARRVMGRDAELVTFAKAPVPAFEKMSTRGSTLREDLGTVSEEQLQRELDELVPTGFRADSAIARGAQAAVGPAAPNVIIPQRWRPTSRGVFDRDVPLLQGSALIDPRLRVPTSSRATVSPFIEALSGSRSVRRGLEQDALAGLPQGGFEWYELGPIKADLDARAGQGGALTFADFVNLSSAASVRNSTAVEPNVMSVMLYAMRNNVTYEQAIADMQAMFGFAGRPSMMGTHTKMGERAIREGILAPLTPMGPDWKVPWYAHGKFGGSPTAGVALDAHERKRLIQLAMENRRLEKLGRETGAFEDAAADEGKLYLKNALDYDAVSELYRAGARDLGLPSSQAFQAGRWLGGGHHTGLQSAPFGDYVQTIEDALLHTARTRGKDESARGLRKLWGDIISGRDFFVPFRGEGGFPVY